MVPFSHRLGALSEVNSWNLDIDRFLNPFIPAPRWQLFPRPVAHFLGYREGPTKPLGNVLTALWGLIGAFCGVALIASISKRVPSFEARDAPAIIGSFVCSIVLGIFDDEALTDSTRALQQSSNSVPSSRLSHSREMRSSVRCGHVLLASASPSSSH